LEIRFEFASNIIKISTNEINKEEGGFVAVMMTSEEKYKGDLYSFEVDDTMFTKSLGKPFSAVRLHLIGNFIDRDVKSNFHSGNQMRIEPFKRMLVQINRIVFELKKFRIEP